MNQSIELLAPAGSYEAFEAALGAGADAIYVGGPEFGARAYANNFTKEELIQAIRTAHIHGKKLYLTVNTLLKNKEIKDRLYESLLEPYMNGLDAVIVQDIGVFEFIKGNFPGLHLHASTQMTITGPGSMKLLENMGATRVVAARELSLEELKLMHETSPIEIEAFIHGALCYSFSGQCLMSSILGGRSGNRGRCAQPCRLSYQARKPEEHYKYIEGFCPLSLKDMCTIDILPEIIEAGVTSLKIEGRMKQPGYTAAVTGVYRKYLDKLINEGKDNYRVNDADRKYILDIFSRGGSCTGYYQQSNGPDMMAFTNERKSNGIPENLPKRKVKIDGTLILYPGSSAILEVSCRDVSVTAMVGEVQYAREQPMSRERILKQINKLGNTEFEWNNLEVQIDESIFVPVSLLNELRREAINMLEDKLCETYNRPKPEKNLLRQEINIHNNKMIPSIFVLCENHEQAKSLWNNSEIQGMYLYYDAMGEAIKSGIQNSKELYLALPYITRGNAPKGYFEQAKNWLTLGMKGFLVRNLESYAMLKNWGLSKYCVMDASMYTWNNEAIAFWDNEEILRNTIPYELNAKEIAHRENSSSEMIVYGNIPLMLSAQCIRKNTRSCDCLEKGMLIKDRKEKEFYSQCVCHPWKTGNTNKEKFCYNILYNSIPLGLAHEADQVKKLGANSLRLNFTTESPSECENILNDFINSYKCDKISDTREYTKGHFKRGVE